MGIFVPGILLGFAAGFGFAQLIGAAMRDVPRDQFGMAGAGRTTIFQLALALGVALAFTIIGRPASLRLHLTASKLHGYSESAAI